MNAAETSVEHGSAACRATKHLRAQYLVTADERSLLDLETLTATLPLCATGRIFIEVPDAANIAPITVPPRMVVTWLDRSTRSGDSGSGRSCAPGQALARAVMGWADEMLCAEHDSTRVTLLGGFLGTADIVDYLTEHHGVTRASIHVPAQFSGLLG